MTDDSFDGKFRDECLHLQRFRNRLDAKVGIELWRRHYNSERPHDSLGRVPPLTFLPRPSSVVAVSLPIVDLTGSLRSAFWAAISMMQAESSLNASSPSTPTSRVSNQMIGVHAAKELSLARDVLASRLTTRRRLGRLYRVPR